MQIDHDLNIQKSRIEIKLTNESIRVELHLGRHLLNLSGLVLAAFGLIILAWVGWLTWYDTTTWGKDIAQIFFGSRTGEAISLGIGMKVIYYFSIGLALFLLGLFTFLRRRIKEGPAVKPPTEKNVQVLEEKFFSGCLYHFGYLAGRPKNVPIPQECILCQRLGDCMVATVFTDEKEASLE
jgi:hypothetical protein